MARKGISIPVAADTREFSGAVKRGVVDPLEDVEDALKDVDRQSERTGRELEDSMRDAQRDTERLAEKTENLNDAIKRAGRSGKNIGDGVGEGTSRAKADLQELGREARQNAAETFSSFDGSAESFADGIQGTLGGIVSELGPMGAAAGAAGALGIGLIMAALQQAEEDNQRFKEQVAELGQELIDTGGDGSVSIGYIADQLKELATTTDDSEVSLGKVRRQAKDLGLDFKDLAMSYAGGTENIEDQIDAVQDLIDEENERYRENVNQYNVIDTASASHVQSLEAQKASLERVAEATEEARQQEADWIAVGGPGLEVKAEQIDALQGELDGAIGLYSDFLATEEEAANPEGYITAMGKRIEATSNFNGNVNKLAEDFGLSYEEQQAILDQGLDFAPMLQSIIDSGLADEFVAQVQAAVGGGQEIVDGQPLSGTVDVDADTGKAEQKIDATADKKAENTVKVQADTTDAEKAIDKVADAKYTAKINATASTGDAETALNNFIARARTVTIKAQVVDSNGRKVY